MTRDTVDKRRAAILSVLKEHRKGKFTDTELASVLGAALIQFSPPLTPLDHSIMSVRGCLSKLCGDFGIDPSKYHDRLDREAARMTAHAIFAWLQMSEREAGDILVEAARS